MAVRPFLRYYPNNMLHPPPCRHIAHLEMSSQWIMPGVYTHTHHYRCVCVFLCNACDFNHMGTPHASLMRRCIRLCMTDSSAITWYMTQCVIMHPQCDASMTVRMMNAHMHSEDSRLPLCQDPSCTDGSIPRMMESRPTRLHMGGCDLMHPR